MGTEPIRLAVEGMTCDHCETTVAGALSRAGLEDPDADWRRGLVIGTVSANFSTGRAADELEAVGYRLVETDQPVRDEPTRSGIDLVRGTARFTGPDTVDVDGREVRTGRFLVATGAAPGTPPIEGLDETGYLTSTTALDRIAPFEEPEIFAAYGEHLASLGATVHTSATATEVGRVDDRRWLEVTVDGATERLEAEQLLIAAGRRAHTGGLGLQTAGVELDHRGHVVVDDRMATANPKVFAAGDVTPLPQFVYGAALSGSIAG